MYSFNERINEFFPLQASFSDFDGRLRHFDFYVCEISAESFLLVAEEVGDSDLKISAHLHADPDVTLSCIKREIVQRLAIPVIEQINTVAEDEEVEAQIESDGLLWHGHHVDAEDLMHLLPYYEGARVTMHISRNTRAFH